MAANFGIVIELCPVRLDMRQNCLKYFGYERIRSVGPDRVMERIQLKNKCCEQQNEDDNKGLFQTYTTSAVSGSRRKI